MRQPPETCRNMTELRAAIDTLDAQIIDMLAERARYIDRAADLKQQAGLPARIDSRVEEVADKARANAQRAGFDPDLAEKIWRQMIEWSILREERAMAADT